VQLEKRLFERGCRTIVLDGDNVRHGLNKNLGFSKEDREENIRRISELAKLFTTSGIINIAAFISPYRADRDRARSLQGEGDFIEVFLRCPLEVCEGRDPKGLYRKARAGLVKGFTGIDDPYEEPMSPELVLDTENNDAEECVDRVIGYLETKGIIKSSDSFITVVSGLPRTGTSMMMKMLMAGGMEVLTDNVRKADIDNPEGYFELEKVKGIKEDSSWLKEAQGKVFKMVSMLLYELPEDYRFKIIFMEREMSEVLASQRKMLDRLKPGDRDAFIGSGEIYAKHLAEMKAWLSGRGNIKVLYMNYNEMMEAPALAAAKVKEFLRLGLDEEKMAGVVKRDLYRNRAGLLTGEIKI